MCFFQFSYFLFEHPLLCWRDRFFAKLLHKSLSLSPLAVGLCFHSDFDLVSIDPASLVLITFYVILKKNSIILTLDEWRETKRLTFSNCLVMILEKGETSVTILQSEGKGCWGSKMRWWWWWWWDDQQYYWEFSAVKDMEKEMVEESVVLSLFLLPLFVGINCFCYVRRLDSLDFVRGLDSLGSLAFLTYFGSQEMRAIHFTLDHQETGEGESFSAMRSHFRLKSQEAFLREDEWMMWVQELQKKKRNEKQKHHHHPLTSEVRWGCNVSLMT